MVGVLVMLNNFFHDFATAIMVVCTFGMFFTVRYISDNGDRELKKLASSLFPRIMHTTIVTTVLLLMAGIVRSFTYKWFEWVEVLGNSQIIVLGFKHVVMFSFFAYGIYIWVGIYRKVKEMRRELSENAGS